MMVILPRTLNVFLIGTFIIASILRLLLTLFPIRFFRKEIIHMSEKQEREIYRILTETASASIFLSISVLTFTVEFVGGEDFSLLNVILTLASGLILFVIAFFRERKASSLTHELAVSLVNSGWRKKYEKMRKS